MKIKRWVWSRSEKINERKMENDGEISTRKENLKNHSGQIKLLPHSAEKKREISELTNLLHGKIFFSFLFFSFTTTSQQPNREMREK